MAFLHFARAPVDAAVVEVGLGGRLDATNVLIPRAAVVTTIGLDHERYLGSTIAAIAAEKGGIFKPAVPAIVGRVGDEARSVLETMAAEQGSPLRLYGRDFRAELVPEGFDYHGRRTIRAIRPGLDSSCSRRASMSAEAAMLKSPSAAIIWRPQLPGLTLKPQRGEPSLPEMARVTSWAGFTGSPVWKARSSGPSRVNLPAKTHSRRRSARSAASSRSWLQSIVVRSVW